MTEIIVLGADGYTGWPLVCRLLEEGHDVVGLDHMGRRGATQSVTPIVDHQIRAEVANESFAGDYGWATVDITNYEALERVLDRDRPDTVVNLAQIPSAPFSMQNPNRAWLAQQNNVQGSLNLMWALKQLDLTDTHVVQLATMGEYGTPDEPLPEGFLDDGRPAPKEPGSFYHASKVAMTTNTLFASRTWGIPVTEIYQGIVYGVSMFEGVDERLMTRFDVDETWGTVLNRFSAQAVAGEPLTVYGEGGQTRAMLSLPDCIQCLERVIETPPAPDAPGKHPYRAVNQFDAAHRVQDLAEMVRIYTGAEIEHVANPREEDDSDHYYEPERGVLDELGYEPTRSIGREVELTLDVLEEHAGRIPIRELWPSTAWA